MTPLNWFKKSSENIADGIAEFNFIPGKFTAIVNGCF